MGIGSRAWSTTDRVPRPPRRTGPRSEAAPALHGITYAIGYPPGNVLGEQDAEKRPLRPVDNRSARYFASPRRPISAFFSNPVRGGDVTAAGLSTDSVANVSQLVTLDKRRLAERAGAVDHDTLDQIEAGLRLVLDLVA